jgi:hypothetical protein
MIMVMKNYQKEKENKNEFKKTISLNSLPIYNYGKQDNIRKRQINK